MSLPPYTLGPLIGKGGSGRVYAATFPDGRAVAVKTLHASPTPDERRRLLAEAKLLRALDHPNIVRFYGVDEVDDGIELRLLQEYVQGSNLAQLQRQGRLPFDTSVHIARQLLAALDHLHARGLVHRDVTPANVFIARDGTVKLGDFGLARTIGERPTTGTVVHGTPHYLSPEQASGQPLDARSDLFNVGAILYELLAGARPIDGPRREAVARAMNPDLLVPLTTIRPGIPRELNAIVMCLLHKDRSRRFQSARATLDALSAVPPCGEAELATWMTERHPRPAAPAAPAETARRTRRLPWALGMAGMLVAGLVLGNWLRPIASQPGAPPGLHEATASEATQPAEPVADASVDLVGPQNSATTPSTTIEVQTINATIETKPIKRKRIATRKSPTKPAEALDDNRIAKKTSGDLDTGREAPSQQPYRSDWTSAILTDSSTGQPGSTWHPAHVVDSAAGNP